MNFMVSSELEDLKSTLSSQYSSHFETRNCTLLLSLKTPLPIQHQQAKKVCPKKASLSTTTSTNEPNLVAQKILPLRERNLQHCTYYFRRFQLEDTGFQPFPKWLQFLKFNGTTGGTTWYLMNLDHINRKIQAPSGIRNCLFETPYCTQCPLTSTGYCFSNVKSSSKEV